MRIVTKFAAASVALVVLIDLATGQGPPVYTNYMQAQQDFRPPPPPAMLPMRPVPGYMQQADYPPGSEMDKKAIELGKGELKDAKKFEKELEKEMKKEGKEEKGGKYGEETTPAPGVLSSFSNSMNDAWKSISSLGRSKRASPSEAEQTKTNITNASSGENPKTRAMNVKSDGPVPIAERSMDNYEYMQYKNQGYVYFKVPKYLVCNY